MSNTSLYIIWDFDGTLAWRCSGDWEIILLKLISEKYPDFHIRLHEFENIIQPVFYWNQPNVAHIELNTSTKWWDELKSRIVKAVSQFIPREYAVDIVNSLRDNYINPSQWILFPEAYETLKMLEKKGFYNIILTNHVPELGQIIEYFGLNSIVKYIYNSASIGYEKPNPLLFNYVFNQIPREQIIAFIGNSMRADYRGAKENNIPFILMHKRNHEVERTALTFSEVIDHVSFLLRKNFSNFDSEIILK
jgi:putative hydrolase of the HAD superfamily